MRKLLIVGAALALAGLAAASTESMAQTAAKVDPALLDAYLKKTFKKLPEGWTWETRVGQDETQRICSETRNNPSASEAKAIMEREKATVAFPADGKVIGDWKEGEKIAQNGRGGQFSDAPGTPSGGNCYACHQMSAKELSYGTLGPSLFHYGKLREFKPEAAKAAFAKIYNPHGVRACSNMPRFGHAKVLTEKQIMDAVAYLFDPESPVNK